MAKYKAIKPGYDGIKVREAGEEFEFDGKPGSWMETLEKPEAEEPEGAKARKSKENKDK